MPDPARQALSDCVARNIGVALIAPAEGPCFTGRSRLLAETPEGIWIQTPNRQDQLLETLQKVQKPVAISFRSGEYNVRFASCVLRRDPGFVLSSTATVDAAMLAIPTVVEMNQRRAGYRVKTPLDAGLRVSLKRPQANPVRATELQEMQAMVRDISTGGVGLIVPPVRGMRVRFEKDERVQMDLIDGDMRLQIDATLRHPPQQLPDGSWRAGFHFTGLGDTYEGRRAAAQIAHLIALFERTHARRSREKA